MPEKKEPIRATIAARPEKARLTINRSRPKARPRVSAPARSVGSVRRLRKTTRRAMRSITPSRRRVTSPIVWPTSSMKPTLWALIAARSSGASAIRSTRRCASSLASNRRQTSSTISLSSASIRACFTVSLSSAPRAASSTSGPCSTRTSARSTASLSTAATIASSAATSTARSIPAALPTERAPRTPAPSSRTESGNGAWESGPSAIAGEYTVAAVEVWVAIRPKPRPRT